MGDPCWLACGVCGSSAVLPSKQKLLTHLRTAHDIHTIAGLCVASNACPCCPAVLATRKGAVKHLKKSIIRGYCISNRCYSLATIVEPKVCLCKVCGLECAGIAKLNVHVREHLPPLGPRNHGSGAARLPSKKENAPLRSRRRQQQG